MTVTFTETTGDDVGMHAGTSTAENMAGRSNSPPTTLQRTKRCTAYKDSELAIVAVGRHKSTSFAHNDSIWAKYGKQLSEQAEFTDPKSKEPPKINVYSSAGETVQAGKMDALIKKGVQFAVCQMSTRGIAGSIAKANGVETDNVVKEINTNLIGNARMVLAGILAVNCAQERGYSFIHAI